MMARKTKKYTALILAFLIISVMLSACGKGSTSDSTESSSDIAGTESENPITTDGNTLVAYFAYSENIGDTSDMEVDAITSASLNRDTDNTEGNLQVMAQIIAEETGADVFHILVEEPYDPDYSTMLPAAVEQMENEDWPALQEKIENLADYDVIYLGTPV